MEREQPPRIQRPEEGKWDKAKAFLGFWAAGGLCGGKAASVIESSQPSADNIFTMCFYGSFAVGATIGAVAQWKAMFEN